jgi:hypothetical protein
MDADVDVLRRFPDGEFEFAGAPKLEPRLGCAEARRLAQAFTFLGHRDDIAARLAEVESVAGGILEVVNPGTAGALVRPGEPPSQRDATRDYSFARMVAAFESIDLTELTRRGVIAAGEPQWAAS